MRFARSALLGLLPLTRSLVFQSEEKAVNFDDRRSTSNHFQIHEVGVYGGLRWSGFSIDAPRLMQGETETSGVEVKSPPNYAGGRIDAFGGLPSINSQYVGSNVAFFDLERFWWGCTTPDPVDSEEVPGWCTLEVSGFAHDAKEPVAKAISFYFPKNNPRSMPMIETILPGTFRAISRVEFKVVASNPVLYLDDVSYKLYNVTAITGGLAEIMHGHETSQSELNLQIHAGV